MNSKIEKLREIWEFENIQFPKNSTENNIASFQTENNVLIPEDVVEYFIQLNGSNDEYDERFFRFYSLSNFKSINDELKNYRGIPDYSNIVNTLTDYGSYFVFADYCFCLYSYAIKLSPDVSLSNEVLAICGDKYQVIANSFSEFLDLHLNDSDELTFW